MNAPSQPTQTVSQPQVPAAPAAQAAKDEHGSLTIGIDARAAAEVPAGRGRVVRELLRALAARAEEDIDTGIGSGPQERRRHVAGIGTDPNQRRRHVADGRPRYILYAREPWIEVDLDERFQWRLLDAKDPWWHVRAARAANRECDVFLSSNSYLTTRFLHIPVVPIVHDLAAFERGMSPNRRSQAIERLTLGMAVRRSAALLAVSQATAEALIKRYPGAASRIAIAPLGVAPGLNGANPSLNQTETSRLPPAGFVLAVGTLEPRKNLPRLVQAYTAIDPELQAAHPLVVVGALGWDTSGTLEALRSLGERCRMLGYVSDEALAELYRRCAVFCYPSLGEGFGLPVLEAMAAGATVLTSNVSSLPEVGGEAVAYADPLRAQDIAGQLQALLRDDDRRRELSARARTRAGEFSWSAFAEVVLVALREAAQRTRR